MQTCSFPLSFKLNKFCLCTSLHLPNRNRTLYTSRFRRQLQNTNNHANVCVRLCLSFTLIQILPPLLECVCVSLSVCLFIQHDESNNNFFYTVINTQNKKTVFLSSSSSPSSNKQTTKAATREYFTPSLSLCMCLHVCTPDSNVAKTSYGSISQRETTNRNKQTNANKERERVTHNSHLPPPPSQQFSFLLSLCPHAPRRTKAEDEGGGCAVGGAIALCLCSTPTASSTFACN